MSEHGSDLLPNQFQADAGLEQLLGGLFKLGGHVGNKKPLDPFPGKGLVQFEMPV
jgi:hypothetical protein